MDDHLHKIEEKFGFLEHRVDQLDEVIRELFAVTDALKRDLVGIQSHVERVESKMFEDQSEEEAFKTA